MMLVFAIIFSIEIIALLVLKEHFYKISKPGFFISVTFNLILSIWLWYLLFKVATYKGFYDTPENISNHMSLTGMMCAVVFPRVLLGFLHYAGKLFRIRKGGHSRFLTNTGLAISLVIITIISSGSFIGRFNFTTEKVTVRIKELDPELDGLRIVHLSDMHLASFNGHYRILQNLIEKVNSYQPDIIINTGDFISYGWREYDRCDTILVKAKSRFGNFAVFGNHDMGTYFPDSNNADREAIILKMDTLIASSGYLILKDNNVIKDIKGAKIAFIGVKTGGRHPAIIHGNIKKAMEGTDSTEFKILLCHDPNQWQEDVLGKTDIDLTFAGHTHGMQMGIITKKFRWSPAKYFYPNWNGLYSYLDQYLYVNRGLGVLAIPFRIWMPPEITVLTLEKE